MNGQTIMLRTLCDMMCQDNEASDDLIVEKIMAFRQMIPREQGVVLNKLLDDINNADSEAKYEAFEKGFLLGLLLAA